MISKKLEALAAMVVLSSVSCSSGTDRFDESVGDQAPRTVVSSLNQAISLGDIRSNITVTMNKYHSVSLCDYGSSVLGIVKSDTDSITYLDNAGYESTMGGEVEDAYDALDSGANGILVLFSGGAYLYVPDSDVDGLGTFLDLYGAGPSGDEWCVTCTEYVGETQGSGCHCSRVTVRECGENPSVSCTSTYSYCPTPPESINRQARNLCSSTSPWSDSTLFTTLSPSDTL